MKISEVDFEGFFVDFFAAVSVFTCPVEGWYRFSRRAMHELLPPPEGPTSASTCQYSVKIFD